MGTLESIFDFLRSERWLLPLSRNGMAHLRQVTLYSDTIENWIKYATEVQSTSSIAHEVI